MITNIDFFAATKVIPVLAVDDVKHSEPLANALVAGGLKYLEVTLRTPAALDVISSIAAAVPDAIVGVGSVRSVSDLESAVAAGAQFAVSPGSETKLINAALDSPIPFLPGAATPSEAMTLLAAGFHFQKFFPAEINGGAAALKAWSGPLGQLRFCPTGGIKPSNVKDYLALPNVVCVGGSWMVPSKAILNQAWDEIESLSKQAVALTA